MVLFLVETLSTLIGVPLDQVLAFLFGFLLKTYLPPQKHTITQRHLTEVVIGVTVMYLCYEEYVSCLNYSIIRRVMLLFLQAMPTYLLMIVLPPHIAQYAVLLFTMTFLSWIHIQRLDFTEARQQSVDITAPLMIQTQKLSSLAFNLYDGDILTEGRSVSRESHRLRAIKNLPMLLPFFGYLLCFQNSMVGPFLFYTEYLCFIEGREEDLFSDPLDRELVTKNKKQIRDAKAALRRQAIAFLFHVLLTLYALSRYGPEYLISEEFQRLGIFRKYFWLTLYGFYLRQKFYCAWSISALAMLISGFGFSGFSSNGTLEPEYRNAINARFFDLGTNTKVMLDNWNIGTTRWLRECVYERAPRRFAVVAVFFVSAFWHGFYPVYYFCFLSAALLTMTGRLCRARLRPCFIESYWYHLLYDIVTNLAALFSLNYLGMGFFLLDTSLAFKLWGNFYYLGHIVPLLMLFLLPYALPSTTSEPRKGVVDVTYELKLDPASGAATQHHSFYLPHHFIILMIFALALHTSCLYFGLLAVSSLTLVDVGEGVEVHFMFTI
uniref:O acyltransferase membrane bound domain n=1 Tax=Echinococcus granulosus TaxID=6210 RepID=A0A068WHF1_ECHGR|nr:o acyltransferase membrane bound domain [Echinococcus granulosus]